MGLLLVRQNQTKHRDTADDAVSLYTVGMMRVKLNLPTIVVQQRFLRLRAHPVLGLETLAIMFSLPYALLMWR